MTISEYRICQEDLNYLMSYLPDTVIVESIKLDNNGIEIVLERGMEDFADWNELEPAEEIFPAEDGLPACLVQLCDCPEYKARIWQFDDIEEAMTE